MEPTTGSSTKSGASGSLCDHQIKEGRQGRSATSSLPVHRLSKGPSRAEDRLNAAAESSNPCLKRPEAAADRSAAFMDRSKTS